VKEVGRDMPRDMPVLEDTLFAKMVRAKHLRDKLQVAWKAQKPARPGPEVAPQPEVGGPLDLPEVAMSAPGPGERAFPSSTSHLVHRCSGCGEDLLSRAALEKHMVVAHSGKRFAFPLQGQALPCHNMPDLAGHAT